MRARDLLTVLALAGCTVPHGDDAPVTPGETDAARPDDTDTDTDSDEVAPHCVSPLGFCERGVELGLGGVAEHGRGLLVADLDNDGWEDLVDCGGGYQPGGPDRTKVQLGRGDGTFETVDVGLDPVLTHDCWGVAGADYDADGDVDVLFLPGGNVGSHALALYRNDLATTGKLTEVTYDAGILLEYRAWWGASFGDVDLDGCLDVVATSRNGRPWLLMNQCDGTFRERAAQRGITATFPLETAWGVPEDGKNPVLFDLDLDGDLDLYLGGYVHEHALFVNDGAGRFTDVTATAFPPDVLVPPDAPDRWVGVFAAAAADFDQDGWPDLYLGRQSDPDYVALNQHDGTFRLLQGETIGLDKLWIEDGSSPENTMGLGVGDLFADGWPDVLLGTGTMAVDYGALPIVFCNQGPRNGQPVWFERCSDAMVDAQGEQRTHGISVFDVDHDGQQDAVYNLGGSPYIDAERGSDSSGRNFVYLGAVEHPNRTATVRLHGRRGHDDALGARIEVVGEPSHWVFVTSAQGYQSTNGPWTLLPLDDRDEADVVVTWPGGATSRHHVVAGERVTLEEPGSDAAPLRRLPRPPRASLASDAYPDWRPPPRSAEPACDVRPPR